MHDELSLAQLSDELQRSLQIVTKVEQQYLQCSEGEGVTEVINSHITLVVMYSSGDWRLGEAMPETTGSVCTFPVGSLLSCRSIQLLTKHLC